MSGYRERKGGEREKDRERYKHRQEWGISRKQIIGINILQDIKI